MLGIIYISRSKKNFENNALFELANTSSLKNSSLGITGYLFYNDQYFLQYIEGHYSVVRKVFQKIKEDTRHQVLHILEKDGMETRKFPEWDMEYLHIPNFKTAYLEALIIENVIKMIQLDIPSDNSSTRANIEGIWKMVDKLAEHKNELVL